MWKIANCGQNVMSDEPFCPETAICVYKTVGGGVCGPKACATWPRPNSGGRADQADG